ncbi:hypothetical protein T4A_2551 [Trichinella pseudospiralis]|uniref:Uncharacterized protein n=1 Tax=Trichinella pseudospiralis TaxID=6337 RepID=A0A0V1EHK7_TRIPS|nr:hypothetical protein T4A_2551 [Trichinella pseudospiralis]
MKFEIVKENLKPMINYRSLFAVRQLCYLFSPIADNIFQFSYYIRSFLGDSYKLVTCHCTVDIVHHIYAAFPKNESAWILRTILSYLLSFVIGKFHQCRVCTRIRVDLVD